MEVLLNFVIWVFSVFGLTTIATQSYILEPIRNEIKQINSWLGVLFSCPLCFSFWAAIIVSILLGSPSDNLFIDGCLGCGLIWYATLKGL